MSFEIKKFNLSSKKIKKSVKLAIISDLHGNIHGIDNKDIVDAIYDMKPTATLILGDMIACKNSEKFYSSLKMYSKLLDFCPCYFINGNHEEGVYIHKRPLYMKYKKEMKRMGVKILSNSSYAIPDTKVILHGIRLPLKSYVKFAPYNFKNLNFNKIFVNLDKECYNILLSHNPYVIQSKSCIFDLICAGHMHGGGVRLPKIGAIFSPNLLPFPKYNKGIYNVKGCRLIVSGGLGDHFPMKRFRNPYQLLNISIDRAF